MNEHGRQSRRGDREEARKAAAAHRLRRHLGLGGLDVQVRHHGLQTLLVFGQLGRKQSHEWSCRGEDGGGVKPPACLPAFTAAPWTSSALPDQPSRLAFFSRVWNSWYYFLVSLVPRQLRFHDSFSKIKATLLRLLSTPRRSFHWIVWSEQTVFPVESDVV